MSLIQFTSYDDVRAALGVSDDEIEDTTLALPLYWFNLNSELSEISATLASDFLTLVTAGPGGLSAQQTALYQAVWLFSTYAVAKHLTGSLPLFSPQTITDGKGEMSRYRNDPYKNTITQINSYYSDYKSALTTLYGAYSTAGAPTPTVRTYIQVASPTYDPITG